MTIRLRLTLIYGGLFLCSALVLLAITYSLVHQQYTGTFFIKSGNKAVIAAQNAKRDFSKVIPQGKGPLGVPVGTKLFVTAPKLAELAAQGQAGEAVHTLFVDSALALAIAAALSFWLGWVIAGRALRPLRTITETVRDISASNLHRRLALEGPEDELRQLGATFDQLLARLERSFEAQRQFVANASHELRTPLTLERTLVELALSDPNANLDSYRHTYEQLLAVGEHQERLLEALLTLSRSQRGLESRQPVDLAAVTEAAVAAVDSEGLTLDVKLEPAITTGNPRLVERLVANLLGNAIDHNVEGGHVAVTVGTRHGHAVLTVTNTGPTIPERQVERLFMPFQRLDSTRGTEGTGLGLGLSIVQAVADAHGATVTATARAEGGLHIEVSFPPAADSD